MTYEYSCGAVVFTRIDGCPTICWSGRRISRRAATAFPRATWGRRDGTGTALREIFEETGVRLTLLEGFRAVTEYALPIPDTWKRVVFFLGEYEYQTVRVQ